MFRLGIFEDERIVLDSICNHINWSDYDCEIVCSSFRGTDAIDLIKLYSPDIIITDIQMGETSGLDLCEFLQKEYPNTQKIIITGYGKIDYAKRAIKSSVIDFILKPIDRSELVSAVKKASMQPALLLNSRQAPSRGMESSEKPQECFYPITAAIICCNRAELTLWFQKMLNLFRFLSEDEAKFHYIEFFIYLKDHLKPYKIDIDELMPADQLINAFKNRYTFPQITMLISNLLEISYNQRQENMKNGQSISSQIRQYIEKNYGQPLSVKIIAAEFHYNPKYLSAVFKKETGTGINDLILSIRLEKAASMMQNPAVKNHDIAKLVGIPDARYFSQVFKKMMGMTPTEYRRLHM